MSEDRLSLCVRWLILASLTLFMLKVSVDMVRHPIVVTMAGESGIVFSFLMILAVFIYAWFAIYQTRSTTTAERGSLRIGAVWGLVCGTAWAIELIVANLPVAQSWRLNDALYYASELAGFGLPAVAGLLATRSTGTIRLGLRA